MACSPWLPLALILTEFHEIVTYRPTNRWTDPFIMMRECIKRYAKAFSWPLLGFVEKHQFCFVLFLFFYKNVTKGRTYGHTDPLIEM